MEEASSQNREASCTCQAQEHRPRQGAPVGPEARALPLSSLKPEMSHCFGCGPRWHTANCCLPPEPGAGCTAQMASWDCLGTSQASPAAYTASIRHRVCVYMIFNSGRIKFTVFKSQFKDRHWALLSRFGLPTSPVGVPSSPRCSIPVSSFLPVCSLGSRCSRCWDGVPGCWLWVNPT